LKKKIHFLTCKKKDLLLLFSKSEFFNMFSSHHLFLITLLIIFDKQGDKLKK